MTTDGILGSPVATADTYGYLLEQFDSMVETLGLESEREARQELCRPLRGGVD